MEPNDHGKESILGEHRRQAGMERGWHQRQAVLEALARGNAIVFNHQQQNESMTNEQLEMEDWERGAKIRMDIIKFRALRPWRRGFACMGILCALGAKIYALDVDANNMPVTDFAAIVGAEYQKSIVVPSAEDASQTAIQSKTVSGTFRNITLPQAITTMEQITGNRAVELDGIIFITNPYNGSASVEPVGLGAPQIEGVIIGQGYAQIKGDKVVSNNSAEVIAHYRSRRVAQMEVLVTDTTREVSDALQEFLNAATVTLSVQGDLFRPKNTSTIDVRSVMAFIDQDKTSNVVMNTTVRIMSGEQIKTAVGRVLEREIYVRPDQTSTDLITRYDTLQLGFELTATTFWDGSAWQFKYEITDTDYTTEQKRAAFTGVDVITEGRGSHILKLNRDVENITKRGIPILAKIPYVKKAFTWTTKTGQKRAINIIINIYENAQK